ncbi:MAG: ATP-binding cassette domain-containing protein [Candidatus Krumholzibacteria bacterium]|nr:ATP-binding cassette domain-containing protein [Candidatus Krumholzibacteria bacterium]
MIKFNNIHLSYDGKKVIEDISFEVKQGEKVVLSGKSGSGKSSLFALALGFVEPGEGEVTFEGVRVDENSVWDIRKKIAYIDQDVSVGDGKIQDLFDFISGLKANVHLDCTKGKVRDLLRYFEFNEDIGDKNIEDLSGGERQRLAIVISVLLERNVFFLDEVTSALDKHLKKKVVDYFMKREDWTFLVISHEPLWLEDPSVKVFDLEEGKWIL